MKKLLYYIISVAIALLVLVATSFFALLIHKVESFILRGLVNTLAFTIFCVYYHRKGFASWFYLSSGFLAYIIYSLIMGTFYEGAHPGYKMIFFAPWIGLLFGWVFNNVSKIKTYQKLLLMATYFFVHYAILFDMGVRAIAYAPMIKNSKTTFEKEYAIGILEDMDTLHVSDLKHEINIFHFWNSACGNCKVEMDMYPELLREFEGRVAIYPANSEMPRDTLGLFYALSQFKESKFIIPVKGFGLKQSPLVKTALYPSTVILNSEGTVVFIGSLDDVFNEFN